MLIDLARYPLIDAPTRLHRLDRVSEHFGQEIWIKRDDCTGFALGGNKGRKLEFLIADALSQGKTRLITCGAGQSNFIRQLGAACAKANLDCSAVVMELPYEETPVQNGLKLNNTNGNVRLDEFAGVKLEWLQNGTWDHLYEVFEQRYQALLLAGEKAYKIPVGGSCDLGAYGLYLGGIELRSQVRELEMPEFDTIVFASSSGSTQVGLASAFHESKTRILGISADPYPEMVEDFADLSGKLHLLDSSIPALTAEKFELNLDYVGHGYGVTDEKTLESIQRMARWEGIFLDPIYTGKAFTGLLDLLDKKLLPGKILFWHTGGAPSLFAY